ncbi:MAG: hypothetical protein M1817_003762 [Caeruleum heppii]|nr:MAG: hypothetical protein M1817_003762 [Caeruleum heppii]
MAASLSPAAYDRPPVPPPQVSIVPCHSQHLHAFRRINSLLLPLRYPDKFYTEINSDPEVASVTRVAVWRDSSSSSTQVQDAKVIGGIRCRIEPEADNPARKCLYVQTLSLLSPYRHLAIASNLLHEVVETAAQQHGISSVYAHVWEQNEDALEWYVKRSFAIGQKLESYYTRLRPGGARIVTRKMSIQELLPSKSVS